MAKYIVLLEQVDMDDKSQIIVHAGSLQEAIAKAKEETGQSVIEVEEDFLDDSDSEVEGDF